MTSQAGDLRGWFSGCNTMEELNRERNILMSVINEEYGKQKQEIMTRVPSFKRVPVVSMAEAPEEDFPVYSPFPKSREAAPSNAILFNATGELSY